MAWSERLPSGRHRGCYRDRSGKKHTLPDTYTQAAEAKRAAGLKEDEVRRRPQWRKHADKITWGAWCDEWWPARDVEPATVRNDASVVRKHLRPRWGNEQLGDIGRDMVQDWVDGLAETPATRSAPSPTGGQRFTEAGKSLSATTVTKAYRVFSASMKAALVAGRIEATPCVGIVLPKPDPVEEHFLTRSEFDQLLAAAGDDDLLAIVLRLGVGTGLRWGELVGLHRNRVDLEQQRIIVQEVYDQTNGEIKPYPKGQRRRGVPITGALAEQLRAWMAAHPATPCPARHRGRDKPCTGSLVVPNPDGAPLNYSNFRRDRFNAAVTAAGVECTPHDLRHTYASWLLQDGVSIEALSALLGHKDIATTQRYAHLADTQWGQVRDVLGGPPPIAAEVSEDTLRQRLEQLAADRPEWAAALAALDDSEGVTEGNGQNVAPRLPHAEDHEEGGKIVQLDRFRRASM